MAPLELSEMQASIGPAEISKSKLIMKLHYMLRDKMDSSRGCVCEIEERIERMVEDGHIVKNSESGAFKLRHA